MHDSRERVTEQAGGGKSEDPGPNDAFDDGPFHAAETFHGADAHDGCGDDVGGGKRDAVNARALNDERGGGFGGEAVHRLQFHDAMPECANNSPAAGGRARRHGSGAKDLHPDRHGEDGRAQKMQPRRNIVEAAGICSRKKSERDNAHGFLRVVRAMTVRHPGRAADLQFPEN